MKELYDEREPGTVHPCEACYYVEHNRSNVCLGCGYNDYNNWQWRGVKEG